MAYIIGALSPTDEKELIRRGWKLEDPPAELIPEGEDLNMKMVWVDTSMFQIMSGPDWEGGHNAPKKVS